MTTASDYDHQVLTTPGFGSTIIPDSALQSHICQIWHAGLTWDLWPMVAHVIAGAHDLYYAAGVEHGDPILKELEFLRQLVETHRGMHRQVRAERIEIKALSATG